MMTLFVDGVTTGIANHSTTWNATGAFQIGERRAGTGHTDYLNAQVSTVQTWNQMTQLTIPTTDPGDTLTGPFALHNDLSGDCLNQAYTNASPHDTVVAWTPCGQTDNEAWWWDTKPNGQTVLLNYASWYRLNQDYTDNIPHSDVIAWPSTNPAGTNELWLPAQQTDGSYTFQNVASGNYLNQDYTNGVPHNTIIAFPFVTGALNQQWNRLPAFTGLN